MVPAGLLSTFRGVQRQCPRPTHTLAGTEGGGQIAQLPPEAQAPPCGEVGGGRRSAGGDSAQALRQRGGSALLHRPRHGVRRRKPAGADTRRSPLPSPISSPPPFLPAAPYYACAVPAVRPARCPLVPPSRRARTEAAASGRFRSRRCRSRRCRSRRCRSRRSRSRRCAASASEP